MTIAGDGFDVRSLALTLDAGASLGDHRHPWGQLVFACSGVMRVSTRSETWLAPATKAVWLPPALEHRIDIQGQVAMRTLYISPDRAAPLLERPVTLEVTPLLRELILHIVGVGMLRPDRPDQDRLAGVLVDQVSQARRENLGLPLPADPRARAVALRLQDGPTAVDGLPSLAAESGASLRTLQRLFPRDTGLTLEAWRRKARLIHAVALLASGISVTSTALESGYQNVGAFIAAFSRHFGTTPGRYRAAQR